LVVILLLVASMMASVLSSMLRCMVLSRWVRGSALEIDIDPALVLLGGILQSQFSAHLLDARFDLLDVIAGVVAFADDAKKMATSVLHLKSTFSST
jgi:hypothetical protein